MYIFYIYIYIYVYILYIYLYIWILKKVNFQLSLVGYSNSHKARSSMQSIRFLA